LFAGVNQIPAGTIAIFDASNLEKISQTPYFIRDFSQNISDEALVRANYLSTLKEVIKLESQSDAMVGCTISGGTDSTTVLALATPHLLKKQARIPVFTIKDSGSESDADLQASIETVAALRKIYGDVYDHQIVDLTSPITLEDFKDATKAMGRPVCDPRFIAMTRFFRAMKDFGIKVVLTGQGSDEINYGYHPLYNWPLTSFYTSEMEFTADNLADEFIKIYAEKIAGYNLEFQTKAIASFREHIEKIMAKTAHITDTKKRVTAVLGDTELQNVFSYEDHPSMYSGIEARVPLANTKLVKIAYSISPLLQLKNNISGRYFLREALAEAGLPDKIVNRDKFPTPKKQNYVGQLIEILSQNRNAITNSDLIKQVYSKAALAMVLDAQNIDTTNQDTGVNTAHRYGNIEDILLNIIGLWQFEAVYFKN
jgi:asparagine synthase (glutamine-hydrolysing)